MNYYKVNFSTKNPIFPAPCLGEVFIAASDEDQSKDILSQLFPEVLEITIVPARLSESNVWATQDGWKHNGN